LGVAIQNLGEILKRLLRENPRLRVQLAKGRVLELWDECVGPQIARHARAERFESGVLYVRVDHPAWRAELHHQKKQIFEKLRARLELEAQTNPEVREVELQEIFFG
jgi:predicted nucleic acid-binding Zn ribbon protein